MSSAGHTSYERFQQVIRAWWRSTRRDRSLALNQVANLTWGRGDSTHTGYICRLVLQPLFREFFDTKWIAEGTVGHSRVLWPAVRQAYPSLVGGKLEGAVFAIMARALTEEAEAIRKRPRGPGVHVKAALHLNRDSASAEPALVEYDYDTDDPEDDAPFPFAEGLPVSVKHANGRDTPFRGTLLAVDERAEKLIVRFDGHGHPFSGVMRERKEALVSVKVEALARLRGRAGVHRRLLEAQPLEPRIVAEFELGRDAQLDPSQRVAVEAAGRQDVTVIWGPPGTGKTHAVGELVAHLARAGKRVLVAAVANVAVDQAALAVVRALDRHGWSDLLREGRLLRHGYARDPDVMAEERLFPQRKAIAELRRQIERDRAPLMDDGLHRRDRAEVRARVADALKRLAMGTREAIDQARVVFTTVHQTAMESAFPTAPAFDVVVLDEASMMSTVDALVAAGHARSQVIIAGDVRQLGPVAVASTEAAQKCLHRDILTHLHVDRKQDPPLVRMLLQQRRMHPEVSVLVNRRFYDGQLQDHAPAERLRAAGLAPAANQGSVVISTEGVSDAVVEYTPTQSRRNRGSARIAATLAAWFATTVRVGLVTAYTSQVALLKRHIASIEDEQVRRRVQVGTIHTFQGSERDVIIWDLVETIDLELGRLFRDDPGRRLVNVAVSRAQGKLVLVGAPSAFDPDRPGSARCLPLSQMLWAKAELAPRTRTWASVQAELCLPELPLADRARPNPAPVPPQADRAPRRRLVRS